MAASDFLSASEHWSLTCHKVRLSQAGRQESEVLISCGSCFRAKLEYEFFRFYQIFIKVGNALFCLISSVLPRNCFYHLLLTQVLALSKQQEAFPSHDYNRKYSCCCRDPHLLHYSTPFPSAVLWLCAGVLKCQ